MRKKYYTPVSDTLVGKTRKVCIPLVTHSVHDHAADLQDGHVGLLALVSLPHYGAHSLQAGVGAVQPGNVTLGEETYTTTHPHYY